MRRHAHLAAVAVVAAAAPALAAPARPPSVTFRRYELAAVPFGAGEPTLGVDPRTEAVLVQARRLTYRVTDLAGRGAWTDVTPPSLRGTVSVDPLLETDRRTGRTFVSHLQAACSAMAYSDDAGRTWTGVPLGCGIGALADHQSVGTGPFRDGATLGATTTYPNAVYYCAHDNVTANCSTSTDGGGTFLPAVPAWPTGVCHAPHGHVATAPDGTVYLPPNYCLDGAATAVSEDNGLTWRMAVVPDTSIDPAAGNASVAVGAGGTAYLAWGGPTDAGGAAVVPYVAATRDRGRTWQRAVRLGGDAGVVNARFVSAVAGDDDRAAVTFLGSRTGGDAGQESFPGVWSLYVSTTYDGGRTWRTVDATPHRPVHRGGVCMAGLVCTPAARVLLDFADAELDASGRVLAVVAVSCRDARCASVADTSDRTGLMLVRQADGTPLRRR